MKEVREKLEQATMDAFDYLDHCVPGSDEYKDVTKTIDMLLKANAMFYEAEDDCESKVEERRIQEERNAEELKLKKWQTFGQFAAIAATLLSAGFGYKVWKSGIRDIREIQQTGAITGKDFNLLPNIGKNLFFKKF